MVMYRYMMLLWNRADHKATQVAEFVAAELHKASPHTWRKTWSTQGIAAFDSGEHKGRMQTYCLAHNQGVILGRLFRNDYTSVTENLDAPTSRSCLNSKGQYLIDNFWGRYVAFFNDTRNAVRYIMRDPSGAFPCFYTSFRGVEIFFSDMQDAADLDFLNFTVNWEYLKANIILPQFQKTFTGLNEVGEVLPAECLEITPVKRRSRFVWNPTKVSETDVIEQPEEAAVLLRSTIKNTVGALASCYDGIVHNLGGLDSSIVLAALADTPNRPEITCFTFFTKSPHGDERAYSRQVAEKYSTPLIESELDWRKADLKKIFTSNKLASPLGFFDCIGLTGELLALAKERNAQALFYGVGGDNVFFQMPYNLGALDYIRRHGIFNKDTLKIAMEASRYGGKSLYTTFRDMMHEWLSPPPCYSYVSNLIFRQLNLPFINPEFLDVDGHEKYLHPLLTPRDTDLKGKYLHILVSALFSIEHYDHFDTEYIAPRIRAYLTQPIIEACLQIPVWMLTYGGFDRGLARKAFQNDLPQDVIMRRTKSTPKTFYRDIFKHNYALLKELLLDGVMVQENILLRDQLEKALNHKDLLISIVPHQLLGYAATEAWLRGWIKRGKIPAKNLKIAV